MQDKCSGLHSVYFLFLSALHFRCLVVLEQAGTLEITRDCLGHRLIVVERTLSCEIVAWVWCHTRFIAFAVQISVKELMTLYSSDQSTALKCPWKCIIFPLDFVLYVQDGLLIISLCFWHSWCMYYFLSLLPFAFGKWYSLEQIGRYACFCILLVWHIMISNVVYCSGLLMVSGHKVHPLWPKASPLCCLFWNNCYVMQWIASFSWSLAHFHCAILAGFMSRYNNFFLWLSANSIYWGPVVTLPQFWKCPFSSFFHENYLLECSRS